MRVSTSVSSLASLSKELARSWEETKDSWRDAKAQEFEQRYLRPLLDGVDTTKAVADKLEKLLVKVRSDCE